MKTTLFCYLFLCLFIDNVLEISSEWSFKVEYNVLEQKMITFLLIDDYIIVCNFVQYTKNHTHIFIRNFKQNCFIVYWTLPFMNQA